MAACVVHAGGPPPVATTGRASTSPNDSRAASRPTSASVARGRPPSASGARPTSASRGRGGSPTPNLTEFIAGQRTPAHTAPVTWSVALEALVSPRVTGGPDLQKHALPPGASARPSSSRPARTSPPRVRGTPGRRPNSPPQSPRSPRWPARPAPQTERAPAPATSPFAKYWRPDSRRVHQWVEANRLAAWRERDSIAELCRKDLIAPAADARARPITVATTDRAHIEGQAGLVAPIVAPPARLGGLGPTSPESADAPAAAPAAASDAGLSAAPSAAPLAPSGASARPEKSAEADGVYARRGALLTALRASFPLATPTEVSHMATAATLRRTPRYAAVFRVGAHANAFYVLLEGSVAIQQRDTSTQGRAAAASVVPAGHCFGLDALGPSNSPNSPKTRAATAIALSACLIAQFSPPAAEPSRAAASLTVGQQPSAGHLSPNGDSALCRSVFAAYVFRRMCATPVLSGADAADIGALTRALRPFEMGAGTKLLTIGHVSEACYFLLHGSVGISTADGPERTLTALDAGCALFGEEGLLRLSPSNARAWCRTPCMLLVLATTSFGRVPWLRQRVAIAARRASRAPPSIAHAKTAVIAARRVSRDGAPRPLLHAGTI